MKTARLAERFTKMKEMALVIKRENIGLRHFMSGRLLERLCFGAVLRGHGRIR